MSETVSPGTSERNFGWAPMIFIALGLAMFIMDTTIVNVSLPSIITDLNITSVESEWVQAIYALVFAAVLIIVGRLGDRYGRRLLFVIGAVLFALASIGAAFSQSSESLILARAGQGLGAAMMSPSSLSLVNAMYRGNRRAAAFAIYGSVIGGMAAIGPLIGGFLTEYYSWRWSFGINIPLAIVIVVGVMTRVPESFGDREERGQDVLGAILSAVGIGGVVLALIEGRSWGWWTAKADGGALGLSWSAGGPSPIPIVLGIAAVALVLLWITEARRARAGQVVLIDVRLFRIASFGLGSMAALILSLGEFGVLFSLPLFLEGALGYTALAAGAVLAALAAGSFISGPTTPRLARMYGPRFVARLGMGLEVVGIAGLGLTISATVTGWHLVPWLVVYGIGVGYSSAQLTSVILGDVPVRQSGQASGTQSTARQVGSALGTAVLGTILFVSLAHDTTARVGEIDGVSGAQATQIGQVVSDSAGTAIPSLAQGPGGAATVEASRTAFADSLRRTALVGSGFVSLGLLATMALPADRRRREDDEADLATATTAGSDQAPPAN